MEAIVEPKEVQIITGRKDGLLFIHVYEDGVMVSDIKYALHTTEEVMRERNKLCSYYSSLPSVMYCNANAIPE